MNCTTLADGYRKFFASAYGNVKLMYPLISGIGELQNARKVVEECKAELRQEGIAFNENIDIGAMVEVPSAALIAATASPSA